MHVIHGDKDDFAPIEIAERLVGETRTRRPMRFERVTGANHFLNDGPVEPLLAALEACIPVQRPFFRFKLPPLPNLGWLKPKGPHSAAPA